MIRMQDQALYRRVFRHLPVLSTERLILRPVRYSDASSMFEYSQDEEVSRYVLWDPHRSVLDSYESIRDLRRQYRHGWPSSYAIALKDSDKLIGTIGFMWLNTENKSAEIGYSLSKTYWNQGFMTEALKAMIGFAFDTLHLHRIEAQHDLRNPASGKVMAKAGMTEEGVLRDRIFNKGRYCSVVIYAIINPQQE